MTVRRLGLVLLVLLGTSRVARAAEPSEDLRDDLPREVEPDGRPRLAASMGLGPAVQLIDGAPQLGIALSVAAEHRVQRVFGLRFGLDWGMTQWQRVGPFFETPLGIAAGTTRAMGDVGRWLSGIVGRATDWLLPVLATGAAVGAWAVLALGYLVAAVCALATPFAATSFFDFAVSGAAHATLGHVDAFVEAGVGASVFWTPSDQVHFGVGPMAGVGFRFRRFTASVSALWLPPALQPGQVGVTAVSGAARLGWAF